jgi:hypothetical protein
MRPVSKLLLHHPDCQKAIMRLPVGDRHLWQILHPHPVCKHIIRWALLSQPTPVIKPGYRIRRHSARFCESLVLCRYRVVSDHTGSQWPVNGLQNWLRCGSRPRGRASHLLGMRFLPCPATSFASPTHPPPTAARGRTKKASCQTQQLRSMQSECQRPPVTLAPKSASLSTAHLSSTLKIRECAGRNSRFRNTSIDPATPEPYNRE